MFSRPDNAQGEKSADFDLNIMEYICGFEMSHDPVIMYV